MSSILIKGMEMPRSCIACHLNFGEKRPEYGLTIYCPYSDGVISWRDKAFDNGRLASCGIVPVPPHGRCVDADEMRDEWLINGENEYVYDTNAFLESIDNQPTVIPAELGGAEGK